MPLPDSYTARAPSLELSPINGGGAPAATRTGSLKTTAMWIHWCAWYVPVRFGEATDTTLGGTVSILMDEAPEARAGSARSAALPALSVTLPARAVAL